MRAELGLASAPLLLRQSVLLTDTFTTHRAQTRDLWSFGHSLLHGCCILRGLAHALPCLPRPEPALALAEAGGVGRELLEMLLPCRASAESASSSLTKLEFGAEERRCHWGDWVEVAESRDASLTPSPAASLSRASPGLSLPQPKLGKSPELRVGARCPACLIITALYLTKVGQLSLGRGVASWQSLLFPQDVYVVWRAQVFFPYKA